MKIYIAGPLFCEGERRFNESIDRILTGLGHETYLPQRDAGCVADLPAEIDGKPVRRYLFELDVQSLEWCDTLLFLFDGRVPDDGACFELGYAYAKGKRCVGYKTDARAFIDGFDNLMLGMSVERTLRTEEELRAFFKQ